MQSFNNKQLETMYIKARKMGNAERAEKYLNILRGRMLNSAKGQRKAAEGLVLEMRDVREHERDGIEVVEHVKGYWVKEAV